MTSQNMQRHLVMKCRKCIEEEVFDNNFNDHVLD